jgi:hypothetical protein
MNPKNTENALTETTSCLNQLEQENYNKKALDNMSKFYDHDERRREARIYRSGEIYIEVVTPEPHETIAPEIVRCEVLDLSATGAQLLAETDLTVGAIHTLVIDLDDQSENYRLTGEVRWCRENRDGFLIGLYFYDSEQTSITDWKNLLDKCLN